MKKGLQLDIIIQVALQYCLSFKFESNMITVKGFVQGVFKS